MKKYTIDAMTTYGENLLKGLEKKDITFTDKEMAWDFVELLDARYPNGHFVVLTIEE